MLLKELKELLLNTPDGATFHRRTAAGKNDRLNWSVPQRVESRKATHLERPRLKNYELQQNAADIHSSGGPLCYKSYRANTTHYPFFWVPNNKAHLHTTFPHCEQYYHANPNATPPTTSTRGHNTPSCTKHMHWNSPWAHVDNQFSTWRKRVIKD